MIYLRIKNKFFFFTLLPLALLFEGCVSSKVSNIQSVRNEDRSSLDVSLDLLGDNKYKYDIIFKLKDEKKTRQSIVSLSDISPKPINLNPGQNLNFKIRSKSDILKEDYFFLEVQSKKRIENLNKSELSFISKDTCKTIQDQLSVKNIRKLTNNVINLGWIPFDSFGKTKSQNVNLYYSYIKNKWGIYLSGKAAIGNSINTKIECNNLNIITENYNNYFFTKNISSDRAALTIGAIYKINSAIYYTLGMGYGSRNLYWEAKDSNVSTAKYIYAKNVNRSYSGLELESGIVVSLNKINLRMNVGLLGLTNKSTNSPSFYSDLSLGMGFNF